MNRTDRLGFIATCATCGHDVNLDAAPENLCWCGQAVCDTHYPHCELTEVTC